MTAPLFLVVLVLLLVPVYLKGWYGGLRRARDVYWRRANEAFGCAADDIFREKKQ